jgi:hypothetical protein
LDWSTPERRHDACLLEVALNRRSAPDVYLGVADIIGPDRDRCDSLVVMRRLPAARSLANLVRAGVDLTSILRSLAHQLAAFHSGCRHDPDIATAGSAPAVERSWLDNCEQMAPYVAQGLVGSDALDTVARSSSSYIRGRQVLFDRRVEAGRIRDGHGDLLADDIFVLDDGARVLDCLEFDAHLRRCDVLADVAFLAMDLEHLGAGRQAASFLARYREFSADSWPLTLAHHWIAHRALIRCKVAGLAHDQGDPDAAARATGFFAQCERHLRQADVRLVLVGGLPGAGKTTTAANLADRLDWALLSSDELRHQISQTHSSAVEYRQGAYAPAMTSVVYRDLLDQAGQCLRMGESVIIDASWTDARWRQQAASLAAQHEAALVEILCVAPSAVTATRIRGRLAAGGGVSEATPAIARQMAADADPWPTARRVDTTAGSETALHAALAAAYPEWTDDIFIPTVS